MVQKTKDEQQLCQRMCKVVDSSACFLLEVQDAYWVDKIEVDENYVINRPYINQLGILVVYNGNNSVSQLKFLLIILSYCEIFCNGTFSARDHLFLNYLIKTNSF